jgi:hypothetical protein
MSEISDPTNTGRYPSGMASALVRSVGSRRGAEQDLNQLRGATERTVTSRITRLRRLTTVMNAMAA